MKKTLRSYLLEFAVFCIIMVIAFICSALTYAVTGLVFILIYKILKPIGIGMLKGANRYL